MNKKDEKKLFRKNTVMSIIITIGFLIFSVICGRLIDKLFEKTNEIFDAKLEKITIPSPVVYYEKIDRGNVTHNPIKDNQHRYGDEIIDQKEVITRCIKFEHKTLLTISSDAVSYIDTVKLNKYGRHRQAGGCKKIGYILTRIFIDGDRLTGESESTYDEFIPGLSASCSFSVELKAETYKIRVETLYCGYLARPKTTVVISGILAEPVNLKDLIKSAKEKEKSRVFLDIHSKEKSQTFEEYKSVGIQPAVAGPAVTCKYEARKANKEKQSASHGGKCPEAVTGQR
jgi:hypothetical protein